MKRQLREQRALQHSHSMQYSTPSASFSMKSKQIWPDMGCAMQHFCTHFRICAQPTPARHTQHVLVHVGN